LSPKQQKDVAGCSDPASYHKVRHNKAHVDKVQDYTEAEIAPFSRPGDLFLAGDSAQSVHGGVRRGANRCVRH